MPQSEEEATKEKKDAQSNLDTMIKQDTKNTNEPKKDTMIYYECRKPMTLQKWMSPSEEEATKEKKALKATWDDSNVSGRGIN